MMKVITDLHTHILPGIDDGAKDPEESWLLLNAQAKQGVSRIVFTPHFNITRNSVESFIVNRENSLKRMLNNCKFGSLELDYHLGAEVFFSIDLVKADLQSLCINDTRYILVELPMEKKPEGLTYILLNIINSGYIPIIAHVERYSYITGNPLILYNLIYNGCLAQINCKTIIQDNNRSKMAIKFIKWGLVQFICSDCHSIIHRPPNMEEGLKALKKTIGNEKVLRLIDNSNRVFENKDIEIEELIKPTNFLGIWL